MSNFEFTAKIQTGNRGDLGASVPDNVSSALPGKRTPIVVKINGFESQSFVAPVKDGGHLLLINKEMRQGATVKAGDTASFEFRIDDAPRELVVPEELKAALAEIPEAAEIFNGMSFSHRREFIEWIAEGKKPETRISRSEDAIAMILAKRRLKS